METKRNCFLNNWLKKSKFLPLIPNHIILDGFTKYYLLYVCCVLSDFPLDHSLIQLIVMLHPHIVEMWFLSSPTCFTKRHKIVDIITSTSSSRIIRSTMSSLPSLILHLLKDTLLTISISTSSKCLICSNAHPCRHSSTCFLVLTLLHGDVFLSTESNSNPQLTSDHALVSIFFMIHLQLRIWRSYFLHRCFHNKGLP